MDRPINKTLPRLLLVLGILAPGFALRTATAQAAGHDVATIRRVAVLNRGPNFELEIETSRPLQANTLLVTGPDRLVVDFANAVPGRSLHPMVVNVGQVSRVRMGLYESKPPVTRIVLDLKSPQHYEVFPSGKKVIVKITSDSGGGVSAAGESAPAVPVQPPKRLEVDFANGTLKIWANQATMAEVLSELQRRTGASIAIPAGAEQQPVSVDLGPGPVRDVLVALLDGSPYNFILLGSDRDPAALRKVILTPRGASADLPIDQPSQEQAQAAPATPEPPSSEPLPIAPDNPPDPAPTPDAVTSPPQ